MTAVEVRSRIIGADVVLPTVTVEVAHEQLTVGQLIGQTVEAQIRELERSYQLDHASIQQALQRQYLTEPELREQASQGRIRQPSAMPSVMQPVDAQQATAKAVDAFRRKAFVILIDGKQVDQLDETVILTPSSKIIFLRLTPLVGG